MDKAEWLRYRFEDFTGLQPYWHPLGFVSLLLERTETEAIRLHYWPAGERRPKTPNWPIHTHIFELESTIIRGCLVDKQYELVSGTEYTVYAVQYDGIDSSIVPTTICGNIETKCVTTHSAASTYRVPLNTFHETVVNEDAEVLTLAVCSGFERADPLVLGQAGSFSHSYQRLPFETELFWSRVRASLTES